MEWRFFDLMFGSVLAAAHCCLIRVLRAAAGFQFCWPVSLLGLSQTEF
jgi:hypothetical protein